MVPNRATHHIYLIPTSETIKFQCNWRNISILEVFLSYGGWEIYSSLLSKISKFGITVFSVAIYTW